MTALNEFVHRNIAFVEDAPGNAGDYWQTPQETLRRRTGDCEDYVFLKMGLLLRM